MSENTEAPVGYEWVNGILKQKQANGSEQSHPNPALSEADYEPEAIKRKVTARLVEELHDPSVKGMPLYKLCNELLNRIDGTPIQRSEASLDVRQVSLEVKAYHARNEMIARLLNNGKLEG